MATRPVHSKVIDGNSYSTTVLGVKASGHMMLRLARVIEPAMRAGAISASNGAPQQMVAAEAFFTALRSLSEADFDYMCEVFGNASTVDMNGKNVTLTPAMQEVHFAGQQMAHIEWLRFCLEANYRDFITAALSKLGLQGGENNEGPKAQ